MNLDDDFMDDSFISILGIINSHWTACSDDISRNCVAVLIHISCRFRVGISDRIIRSRWLQRHLILTELIDCTLR